MGLATPERRCFRGTPHLRFSMGSFGAQWISAESKPAYRNRGWFPRPTRKTQNRRKNLRRFYVGCVGRKADARFLPLRRLEVVDRPHDVDDIHRLGDGADDVLDGLVGARRLIDGALVHRGRIDALHGGPVFAQVERFPCLATRHDAARAVGRRVVPRLVAVPCAPSIVNMAILPAPWRLLGVWRDAS